jgi:Domain of unknown function (DUF4157)
VVQARAVPGRLAEPAGQRRQDDAGMVDGESADLVVAPVPGRALAGTAPDRTARLHRAADGSEDPLGGSDIPANVLSALRRRRGAGRPLPAGPAAVIGHQLGPAASAARLHTDAEADRLASSVQSVAFSYGSDIYFRRDGYAPDTEQGQRLLAHELSHVAQGAADAGSGAVIGRADDPAEREADRSAATVLGALRRQAARLDGGAAALLPTGPTVRRLAGPIRRAYVGAERGQVQALEQVGNEERVAVLEAHNWTAADTVALANHGDPHPTFDQLNAIMGRFSWQQTRRVGVVCQTWEQLAAAAGSGWPAANLAELAGRAPRPTAEQLLAIVAFFTSDQFDRLWPVAGSVANLITLSQSGWTAARLAELAGAEPAPSTAQALALVQFYAADQFRRIWPVAGSFANMETLAGAGWTAARLAAVAGRDPAPTAEQLLGIVQFCTADQAAALWPVAGDFANLLGLSQAGWTAADLVTQAGRDPAPTAEQLLAVVRFFSVAQVTALWPVCANYPNLAALTRAGWTADQLAGLVGDPANQPTFAQLEPVVSRLTRPQYVQIRDAVGTNWARLAGLATAAAPGAQSPAVTLRGALVACRSYLQEQLQAINDGLGTDITLPRYTAMLIGTGDLAGMGPAIVGDYLNDARYFSICFDTAQRLFDELGAGAAVAAGGAPRANYPLAQQQERSAALVERLNAAAQAAGPVIFSIFMGGHGFTLTVIGDQVYQLEAFASQAGRVGENPAVLAEGRDLRMSLLTSIDARRSYPIATVTTAIGRMTSANPAHRQTGAETMGWNADPCGFTHDGAVTDPMAVWWSSANLLSNAQIVVGLARRIERQAAEVRRILGIPG